MFSDSYFIVSFVSLQLFAQTMQDLETVKKEISKVETSFSENFARGDAKAMSEGYTMDAIAFPPNTTEARGRDVIQKVFEEFIAEGNIDLELQADELGIIDNTAVTHGTYQFKLTMKDGTVINDNGKFLEVWEEQNDGNWLRKYDMWNSSLPLSGNN